VLAGELEISRNTVLHCYDQLIAEGYIQTIAAARTMVSRQLPHISPTEPDVTATLPPAAYFSQLGKKLARADLSDASTARLQIDFNPFRTAFDELPLEEWARTLWRVTRQPDERLLDYAPDRAGLMSLRQAIAEHVAPHRGIQCSAQDILIVLGFQQGLDLMARTFLNAGDFVAVEDPSFFALSPTLELNGAKVVPISVDRDGMMIEELFQRPEKFKLICVTPSHQFPTGTMMSLSRRLKLLDWAHKQGSLILEDDLDSEHCYDNRPIPALKTLDEHENVFYLETFSRILYPSLAMGFLISPPRFSRVLTEARRLVCDPVPLQLQHALSEFITYGHLGRHRKHMRTIYQARRDALLEAIGTHLKPYATTDGTQSGLNMLVKFATSFSDEELVARAAEADVAIVSAAPYYFRKPPGGEFVLGYGNLKEETIVLGIRRLAKVLASSN
jgi:GntR family transcriptional regulator/MocR family aminotransferase